MLEFNGTTGAFVKVFAGFGSGGLTGPGGLVFGPDGDLFVASSSNAVLEFNGTTGAFVKGFNDGGLNGPLGLVFGPDGDLYVSSFDSNAVLVYNAATGAFVKTLASGGELSGPGSMTFGPSAVPEPSSLALCGLGAVALAGYARRRRTPRA